MKRKFSKVFFVIVMLLVVSLLAVACNNDDDKSTDPVEYSVTYVGGEGATGTAPAGGEYAEGATFTLPNSGTLSKTDYNFGGWSYGGQTYAVGATFTMPANAVEFTAVWTLKNQIVQFDTTETVTLVLNLDGNDGFIEIYNADDSITTVNFTYTLNDTAIAITLANEGGTFNGTLVANVLTVNITYNTVTYEFKASEPAPTTAPTVNFDANGGTGTAPEATVTKSGDVYKVSIPANTYTAPANKQFKTWEIFVGDVSKGTYKPNQSFIANAGENVTIKAIWEEIYIGNIDGLSYLGNCTVPTTTIVGGLQGGGQTYTKFVVSVGDDEASVSYLTSGASELVSATGVYIDTLPKAADDPVAIPCIFAKLADNLGFYLVLSNQNEVLTIYDTNGDPLENGVFNVHYDNPATYQASSTGDNEAEINIVWYDGEDGEPGYYLGSLAIDTTTLYVSGDVISGNNISFTIMNGEYYTVATAQGAFVKGETLDVAILYNNQYYIFGNAQVAQYTVTFNPQNGSESTSYTVYKGIKVTVPSATTIDDGRTFRGWRNVTLNALYNPGFQIAVQGNWTINAEYVWTVSFQAGEGATGSVSNQSIVEWNSSYFVILPDSTGLTHSEGKKFVGWTCDGGTTVLEAGTHYSSGTGNVIFTAVWEDAPASDKKTYVGSALQVSSIVIDTTTGEVTFNYSSSRESETVMPIDIQDGKFKYSSTNPTNATCWIVITDEGNALKIYDDWNGPDELQATYTLEA